VSPADVEGKLPRIFVSGETYPAAYELAILALHKYGTRSRTHYDQTDSDGKHLFPPSIEAKVSVEIKNPLKEPRMHLCFPDSYRGLESYRQEVVEGIHDSWIEPGTTKWTYTYHRRLEDWNPSTNLNAPDGGVLLPKGVNQIELVLQDLERDITSKGAQATTWMPTADPMLESNRPCLQRIWFRCYENEEGIDLNANWYFRSRDMKAWLMNGWGLTSLVEKVALKLSQRKNKIVRIASIDDTSDSLHMYGNAQEMFDTYAAQMQTDEGFRNRIVRTDRNETDQEQFFQEETLAERKALEENPHHSLGSESQQELARRLSAAIKQNPSLVSARDQKFVRDLFPEFL